MESGTVRKTTALVLYVEDSADIRGAYSTFLRRAGFRVAEAADGVEGVERAIELQPDLIVMDLALPVVDGCEATRRLKNNPRTKDIPVLALTAHGYRAHMVAAHDAGCDEYLIKPVSGRDLVQRVMEMIAARALAKKSEPSSDGGEQQTA
jgi:CheY-like chemotaxis protein